MATKKLIPALKHGDYFKAKIQNIPVTGRVTTQYDLDEQEEKYQFALVFDNDDADCNFAAFHIKSDFGFSNSAEVSDTKELVIITPEEHKKLIKTIAYKGFKGYSVVLKKGTKEEDDQFVFGCGAITVTRKQVEELLAVFAKIKPSKLSAVVYLLKEISDESSEEITDEDIPMIKELLTIK